MKQYHIFPPLTDKYSRLLASLSQLMADSLWKCVGQVNLGSDSLEIVSSELLWLNEKVEIEKLAII